MRGLVPFEVAAVVAVVVAPWPEMLPIALPLFVAATLARMVRGRSWAELMKANGALVGALAGLAALGIALVLGTPVVERLTERAVDWRGFPIVRGNLGQLIGILMIVTCATIAVELALRGWIVERVLELSRAPAILAILVGAFAEALLVDGGLTARLGGGVFGIGLGWMYVASGRNLAAPLCARLAFQLGAVVLEWLKLVG
jgi:hypothetical protein